jgi:glycosyltransferase involved in cell wall biosynthesis
MKSVSVIIPLRNEGPFIRRTLPTILAQDDPRIIEIHLIDGESNDETLPAIRDSLACANLAPRPPEEDRRATGDPVIEVWEGERFIVALVRNPAQYVPQALNLGIRMTRGDILVRMDAHSEYPENYVRQCVDGLLAADVDNYGGVAVTVPASDSTIARAIAAVTSHPLGVGRSLFRTGSDRPGPADTVPFGCFRRELFSDIGGFDERLVRNQDNEFNARIRSRGGTVYIDPSIRFRYFNQATLGGLLRQAWRTGRWNSFTLAWAPHAFRWRYVLPAGFVLWSAACVALLLWGVAAGRSTAVIVGGAGLAVYPLAWAAALPGLARRWGTVAALSAPFVAWLYHNAYGCGILSGLVSLVKPERRKTTRNVPTFNATGNA